MVALPSVADADPTFTAQRSSVSSGEIANVGNTEANTLDSLKTDVEQGASKEVANEGAANGASMVTRAPDGTLQVQDVPHPFVAGNLANIYENSAKQAFQANLTTRLHDYAQDLASKTMLPASQGGGDGDPQWFNNQMNAYVKGIAGNQRDGLQTVAQTIGNEVGGQYYRTLVGQKTAIDGEMAKTSIGSQVSMIQTDLSDLSYQGGTSTPLFEQKAAQLDAYRRQMLADPRMHYSQEQYEADTRSDSSEFAVNAAIGAGRRLYAQTGNLADAQQKTSAILDTIPMMPFKRIQIEGELNRHLSVADGYRSQTVKLLNDQSGAMTQAIYDSHTANDADVNDMTAKLIAAKSYDAAARLQAAQSYVKMEPAALNGSATDARVAYDSVMAQAKNPPAIPGKGGAISKWITPTELTSYNQQEAAAGLPKNYLGVAARIESQDDGDWNSKTGSNVGRFQFNQGDIDTWLGPGHSVDNKDDQAAAMIAEAKSYGPRIQAITGQPATISQLYLAHQQREGFMKMLQDPSAPAVQSVGDPAAITGNQGNIGQTGADFMAMWDRKAGANGPSAVTQTLQDMAHRELVTHVAGIYNNRTQQLWDGIKSAWDKGQQPSSQELDDLNTLMPTVSDNKLRQDVASRLPQEAAKGTLAQFPTQTQSNILSAGQIAATHGDLGYVDREVLARTQQSLQEKQKLLASDPVTYGQKFLPPQAAPDVRDIQPLDMSSPQNFATTLGPRLKVAAVVRQMEPSAVANPLTTDDRAAVATSLRTLPGAQAGGILGQLSQSLSQEQLQEVMKDPGIKASVSGMTTSGDLAKVQAAYSFMGNMEKNNPQMGVEQTFGTPAYQSMRVWQDKTSYEPPADALKEMQTYNDPMNTAAIDKIREASKTELSSITGANVASKLFGGYNPFGPALDPVADNVEGSSDRMLAEYSAAYRDFRTKGDTAAAATAHATEQVSKNWGPSEANGGRIMRNPPETKLLPIAGQPQTIDGSYSWVNDQLKDDIVKSLGFGDAPLGQTAPIGSAARAKLDDVQRDIESSPDRANDYRKAVASHYLVPDDKTDADIASGRNPSYHVVIENADGHMQVLTAAPGSSELLRFRPDFKTAADKFNQGPAQFRHAVTQGVVDAATLGAPLPLQP